MKSKIMTSNQEQRAILKPIPNNPFVVEIIRTYWQLNVIETSVKTIESYEDANFYFVVQSNNDNNDDQPVKEEYLIKFYNAMETNYPDNFYGLSSMLQILSQSIWEEVKVPKIISPVKKTASSSSSATTNDGKDFIFIDNCPLTNNTSNNTVAVRIFAWIDGTTLSRNPNLSNTIPLFQQVGNAIGLLNQSLLHFTHPAFEREHLWDLKQFHLSIPLIDSVDDEMVKKCIREIYHNYQSVVLSKVTSVPYSVIMADCNDANVLITSAGEKVIGLIDFSDAIYTWSVNELAIAMAYGLVSAQSIQALCPTITAFDIVKAIFVGYVKHRKLSAEELEILPTLMAVRLSISVMVGAYSIAQQPENAYLRLHAVPGRQALVSWWTAEQSTPHAIIFQTIQSSL